MPVSPGRPSPTPPPGSLATDAELAAVQAREMHLDVRDYGDGFIDGASYATNTTTLQAAIDAAAALDRGGVVHLPAGEFECKGVILASHVTIAGHGTRLTHPDGTSTDLIAGDTTTTTGTITTGSPTLTVTAATGIEVGTVIGVRAAGGYSPLQFTTLTGSIDASQTTGIEMDATTGFPTSGYMVIGSEVIAYTGISTATLTGVTRGAYGSTAATHDAGDYIGTARYLVAEVTAVSGTTVTLDRNATVGVTSAPVEFGIIRAGIRDLSIDGAKVAGGASPSVNPIKLDLARWCVVDNVDVVDGECAVFLDRGTRDCTISNITAYDCSVPDAPKGSVFWLFRGCERNLLTNITVNGSVMACVYFDNRTTTATEFDGACDDNIVDGYRFQVPKPAAWTLTNVGFLVVGSNRNKIVNGTMRGIRSGFGISHTDQALTGDSDANLGAQDNYIGNVTMWDMYQPWTLTSGGNHIHGATYTVQTNGTNAGGNLITGSALSSGEAPNMGRFAAGTQAAPAISFEGDTGTGFYNITDGSVQFVSNGALVARFTGTDLRMADGMDLDFGTTTGGTIGSGATVKIGFWGATPAVRPTAVADATDAGSVITQLNDLLAKLRTIGVIAT